MSATTPEQEPRNTRAHRWLARLSFVLAGLAIVLLVVVAGLLGVAGGDGTQALVAGINGRIFVNNASFGAYAEVIETPAYRGDKLNTTLNTLPELLQGDRGARLQAQAGTTRLAGPQALLVSIGVDGESVLMSTPVTCTVCPGALRVWVPRNRPGIPRPGPR